MFDKDMESDSVEQRQDILPEIRESYAEKMENVRSTEARGVSEAVFL